MSYRIERWTQKHAPDAAMLRALMEREGYRVFEWADGAGTTYSKHKHDTDQSHCIISGALELEIEEVGTFVLEAGDRDFMPSGTYHFGTRHWCRTRRLSDRRKVVKQKPRQFLKLVAAFFSEGNNINDKCDNICVVSA